MRPPFNTRLSGATLDCCSELNMPPAGDPAYVRRFRFRPGSCVVQSQVHFIQFIDAFA
jgi:hypothetical protein